MLENSLELYPKIFCVCVFVFVYAFLREWDIFLRSQFVFFHQIIFFLTWLHRVLIVACGNQFPDQGSNPAPLYLEHRILATGPPGNSLIRFLKRYATQRHSEALLFGCKDFRSKIDFAFLRDFMALVHQLNKHRLGTRNQSMAVIQPCRRNILTQVTLSVPKGSKQEPRRSFS